MCTSVIKACCYTPTLTNPCTEPGWSRLNYKKGHFENLACLVIKFGWPGHPLQSLESTEGIGEVGQCLRESNALAEKLTWVLTNLYILQQKSYDALFWPLKSPAPKWYTQTHVGLQIYIHTYIIQTCT